MTRIARRRRRTATITSANAEPLIDGSAVARARRMQTAGSWTRRANLGGSALARAVRRRGR
jgi:hypothetical protein